MSCTYGTWVDARIKGQHMLLWILLTALLLDLVLAGTSTAAQRLSRPDIAGHRRICGGGNRFPFLALLFLAHWVFFNFTPFFLSHVLPCCRPRPTSGSRIIEIKFTRLYGIWLRLCLNLILGIISKHPRYWIRTSCKAGCDFCPGDVAWQSHL